MGAGRDRDTRSDKKRMSHGARREMRAERAEADGKRRSSKENEMCLSTPQQQSFRPHENRGGPHLLRLRGLDSRPAGVRSSRRDAWSGGEKRAESGSTRPVRSAHPGPRPPPHASHIRAPSAHGGGEWNAGSISEEIHSAALIRRASTFSTADRQPPLAPRPATPRGRSGKPTEGKATVDLEHVR